MRPGYLGDLDSCWFSGLGNNIFEIQEVRSAQPVFLLKNRVRGKTGEEVKAFLGRGGWASSIIPTRATQDLYRYYPYRNGKFPLRLNQFLTDYRKRSQIFKLV